MNIEQKVRLKLGMRGFSKDNILNNRGLISSTIEATILVMIKDIKIKK